MNCEGQKLTLNLLETDLYTFSQLKSGTLLLQQLLFRSSPYLSYFFIFFLNPHLFKKAFSLGLKNTFSTQFDY